MAQTAQGDEPADSSAAGRLNLIGLRSTVGKNLHARCTVRLNGQSYQSPYFIVSIGGKQVPESVVTGDDIPGYYGKIGDVNKNRHNHDILNAFCYSP